MIKIEKVTTTGWEPAIRGMRNSMNSWDKSDSKWLPNSDIMPLQLGKNDYELMLKLSKSSASERKFMRMMIVYMDITAPLYWWKQFDTYKVGTVSNSCSTMHKISAKEFELDDFSHEQLLKTSDFTSEDVLDFQYFSSCHVIGDVIKTLNAYRELYLKSKNKKKYWWQMIQLLPSSYNQKRTIMLSYEVLKNIYPLRKKHKLDEWRDFCSWIESLPYSEFITGKKVQKPEISDKINEKMEK